MVVLVDVTYEANWAGGYTTDSPPHVVVASGLKKNQGLAGLEVLYHESLHTGLFRKIRIAFGNELQRQGKKDKAKLWHALHFFTVGEVMERYFQKQGISYRQYGYVQELYTRRGPWKSFVETLEQHWPLYLDGRIDLEKAMNRIVSATEM